MINLFDKGKFRVGIYNAKRERQFILHHVSKLIHVQNYLKNHNYGNALLLVYHRKTNELVCMVKYDSNLKKIIE